MNKPLTTALLTVPSLLLIDSALTVDAYGMPRNTFNSVYRRNGGFSQTGRELSQQFGTLRRHLNDGQRALLKKGQIAWIKGHDAAYSKDKDNGYLINLGYTIEEARQRLDFLRGRERGCLSTGYVDTEL